MTDLVYVENMRVAQAKIHEGDVRWYVVNAANHIVRGPWPLREQADGALEQIRERAVAEAEEEQAQALAGQMRRQAIGRDAA